MSVANILTYVQSFPDIGTNEPTYIAMVIQDVIRRVLPIVNLPVYPEAAAQGYSVSAATPGTSLTSLPYNDFKISVDGSDFFTLYLTLANCTTGALTAAEMQTQIRAAYTNGLFACRGAWEPPDEDDPVDCAVPSVFSLVTVVYGSVYTITSPTFGPDSSIKIDFVTPHVCQALKIGLKFSGTEVGGMTVMPELDYIIAAIVARFFRQFRLVPETYERGREGFITSVFDGLGELHQALLNLKRPVF